MATGGNLALDGGDPRLAGSSDDSILGGQGLSSYTKPQMRLLHDPKVSFEEYHYYAQRARREELEQPIEGPTKGFLSTILPSKSGKGAQAQGGDSEKRRSSHVVAANISDKNTRAHVTDEEWTNASRAARTATMGAIFYLITTDILGPFALPYAFATTGWGCVTSTTPRISF